MVPKADSDTELASLKSGEVDFIFPQAANGITDALNDPNIKYTPGYGTNYEALWFQQKTGPFSDDAFRQGFAQSIDRDVILKNIYDPLFPGAPLLDCGPWVPNIGKWCDQSQLRRRTTDRRGRREGPDRGRLHEERRRHVGEGRQGPADPLDGQRRQQAP